MTRGDGRRRYDGPYSPYGESYGESGTTDRNFTGQNQDLTPNGDQYDLLYREYHAAHGRWISPDPDGQGIFGDILGAIAGFFGIGWGVPSGGLSIPGLGSISLPKLGGDLNGL